MTTSDFMVISCYMRGLNGDVSVAHILILEDPSAVIKSACQ